MNTRFLLIMALTLSTAFAQDKPLEIQNPFLQVRFNPVNATFAILAKPATLPFATGGTFYHLGLPKARIISVTDKTFGQGQSIEITDPAVGTSSIILFQNLPFVLFRTTLHNTSSAPSIITNIQPLSLNLDLAKPASTLRTLGTGGLLAADKNPGSYVWQAVADPETRHGVVGAWLTHDRGSGIVLTKVENDRVRLTPQIDYGRLRLAPGQTATLETFALGYFDDARLGLEQWADAVAAHYQIKLPPQPVGYCTWYSKPYGGASDEKHLAEQAAFAATNLAPFGFSVIQIDDHWQAGVSTNGPKRNFTTHAPKGPYPSGMKAAADHIKSVGLTPGLWFMPFAGTWYDPFFKDHQYWFAKRADGTPYETAWGGTCLDQTHPEVREYLRANIRRFADDWGYQYFKMDGLWTGTATKQQYINIGYKPDGIGDAILHNPEKTNIEGYRDGLKLIRETAGPKIFILGCCAPQNMRSYGGAFGLVDAMRIGPDNGANWNGLLRGPTFGSRQYFMHGRIWYNDPDPVYVRPEVPLAQAQAICSWVTISGQLNLNSEWLPALPPERLDLLKRTMPSHGLKPRPADLFENPIPRIWLLTSPSTVNSQSSTILGLFNWDNQQTTIDYPMERIGLDAGTEYVAFDYWANTQLESFKGRVQMSVPKQSCRILALRPKLDRPQLLSTSRHITQGIVDVLKEQWDQPSLTLRGQSKVVAGDPYELRIALPQENWQIDSVNISGPSRFSLLSNPAATNTLARVPLRFDSSATIDWAIKFKAPSRPK